MSYKKIIFILLLGTFLLPGRNVNAQTQTYNYTGATQQWTVPCGVSAITVDVRGAQGGTYGAYTGGLGARMQGVVTVTPGEVLTIWVGQQGIPSQNAGGGGGGSGITNGNTPIVIAGAGGGASGQDGYNGLPGLTTTAGGSSSGPGGTAGNGGDKGYTSGDCGWAGGGGGFLTDGYGGPSGGDGGALPGTQGGPAAGKSALHGGAGGVGGCCGFSAIGSGGWGCGGGARAEYGGGGGGGYSGGGGGQYTPIQANSPGGGGGSYSIAASQTNTQGYQSGNGQVIVTYVVVPQVVTVTGNVIFNENTCNGKTGEVSGIATGQQLVYSWAPGGQTTDTISGLLAGSYTITVTSPCGGSASAVATVTQPPNVISATAAVVTNVSCNGGKNGSASATINGAGTPYTYFWIPSAQVTATAIGLGAGTYTVQTYNVCGASATATVTITQPVALSITSAVTANVICNGGSDGSAISHANSGTPPYNYSWAPSGGNLDTVFGLTAGNYTVTLTDKNGCTGSAKANITQPNVLATSASTVTNVSCSGAKSGSAMSTTTGGTTPYAYAWTGGENGATATNLSAGTYTVSIKDAHGCTASAQTSLTQPTVVNVIKNSSVDSGKCTGSAWVVVSGGVLPYSYAWSNNSTNYYIYGLCGTANYCCVITDGQGCKDTMCMLVNSVLGVDNLTPNAGKIAIYPNPTSGQFTVTTTMNGQWSVEVYNVLGERVYTQSNISTPNSNINIGGQPNGIYLYRVLSGENGSLVGEGKLILNK